MALCNEKVFYQWSSLSPRPSFLLLLTSSSLAAGKDDATGVVRQGTHEQHNAQAQAKAGLLDGPRHGQHRAAHHRVPHAENGDERALLTSIVSAENKEVERQHMLWDDLFCEGVGR